MVGFVSSFLSLSFLAALAIILKETKSDEILSDHAGYPVGVCRYDDETLPINLLHSSVWPMVIDVNEKIIYLTDGTPCKFKPKEYKIS